MLENIFNKTKFKPLSIIDKVKMTQDIIAFCYDGEDYTPLNKELILKFNFMKKMKMKIELDLQENEDVINTYNKNIEDFLKLLNKDKILKSEYDTIDNLVKEEIKERKMKESAVNKLLVTVNTKLKDFDLDKTIKSIKTEDIMKMEEVSRVTKLFKGE